MTKKRKSQENQGSASQQTNGDCGERNMRERHVKDPDNERTALDELRHFLKDDARCSARRDTVFLLPFLRFTKFDVKAALEKTQTYYRRRSSCPKIFKNLKASEEIESQARNLVAALPGKDTHGRPILLLKLGWPTTGDHEGTCSEAAKGIQHILFSAETFFEQGRSLQVQRSRRRLRKPAR